MSPEVVTARTALLERCLTDLLAAPPAAPDSGQPLRAAPAFLAFLQPRQPDGGGGGRSGKGAWKSPLRESSSSAIKDGFRVQCVSLAHVCICVIAAVMQVDAVRPVSS